MCAHVVAVDTRCAAVKNLARADEIDRKRFSPKNRRQRGRRRSRASPNADAVAAAADAAAADAAADAVVVVAAHSSARAQSCERNARVVFFAGNGESCDRE